MTTVTIMELESIVNEIENLPDVTPQRPLERSPPRYYVSVFGTPSAKARGAGGSKAITSRSTSRS